LWPQDYTVRAGHRLILVVSTETTEWDIAKFPYYTGTPGLPTVQLSYEHSESYITLPIVASVSSGYSLFNGTAPAAVPEAPLMPLLMVIGLGAGALLMRRRLHRS
jgi:hypothetical protein